MLGLSRSTVRGGRNSQLSTTLSRNGYVKRVQEQWNKLFNRKFHIEDRKEERKELEGYWQENIRKKIGGVDRARLEAFGTFMEAKEQDWRKDNYIRVRFCNKMGFPTKYRHTDFEKFIVEAEADSIALSRCMELNLSAKGVTGLADVAKNVQKRSKATIVPALDPLKIHKSKDFLKGGLATWMPSHMAGRNTSTEIDQHRRWLTHRFASATNDISIILAYRVCSGTIDSSTSTIANREQQSLLMAKNPSALNVQKAFLNDLSTCIKKERDESRDVLVLGDFNSPNEHQEIANMFAKHNMVDLVPKSAPPTCTRSSPTARPTEVAFGTMRFEQSMVAFMTKYSCTYI